MSNHTFTRAAGDHAEAQNRITSGPWKVERVADEPDHEDEIAINTPEAICVARVWPVGEDFDCEAGKGPNQRANARLIAAAPELLAALQMVCDAGVPLADAIERAMLDAIAKAITP